LRLGGDRNTRAKGLVGGGVGGSGRVSFVCYMETTVRYPRVSVMAGGGPLFFRGTQINPKLFGDGRSDPGFTADRLARTLGVYVVPPDFFCRARGGLVFCAGGSFRRGGEGGPPARETCVG